MTIESLAVKYRPKTFQDLVGQRPVQLILHRMVQTNAVPVALLLSGPRGTGKTTTARMLAAALNCESTPVPCGQCTSCKSIYNGTSLDLIEIDAASNGLVDDIRTLRSRVHYSVTGGLYRIVVLDEAHSMSRAAFDALLKTLEEPPPGCVFVLLTTEPSRIPDTVLSRCMPFEFRRIGAADIVARLRHIAATEHLDVEPDLLHALAERADGGLRDAVMLLDQLARAGITTLDGYAELLGDFDFGPVLLAHIAAGDIAGALAAAAEQLNITGDPAGIADALINAIRDIVVLHAGGSLDRRDGALEARQRLMPAITPAAALGALRTLWDLKTKVRAGDDPRTALDLALVLITEPFARTAQPKPGGPTRMRFDDMKDS